MKIIAHRGFWKTKKEQNTLSAFKRALDYGFGIETDFRDLNETLVISHDLPQKSSLKADELFKLYCRSRSTSTLAINIKSDGLQNLLKTSFKSFKIEDYFIFDASVPDGIHYLKSSFRYFTRHSEVEHCPSLYAQSSGVWIDSFFKDWFDADILLEHLKYKKEICIVSPELHGRPYARTWKILNDNRFKQFSQHLYICTDFPLKAQEYFNKD